MGHHSPVKLSTINKPSIVEPPDIVVHMIVRHGGSTRPGGTRARPIEVWLQRWGVCSLDENPLDLLRHSLLEPLEGYLQPLQLREVELFDGLPEALDLGHPHRLLDILAALLFDLHLGEHLAELQVQLAHGCVPVHLHDVERLRIDLLLGSGVGTPTEETLEDSLHGGVAEGVGLVTRREDDDRDFRSTESADLTGFLEKARAALREGNLKVTLIFHLHDGDLLAALGYFRHGSYRQEAKETDKGRGGYIGRGRTYLVNTKRAQIESNLGRAFYKVFEVMRFMCQGAGRIY